MTGTSGNLTRPAVLPGICASDCASRCDIAAFHCVGECTGSHQRRGGPSGSASWRASMRGHCHPHALGCPGDRVGEDERLRSNVCGDMDQVNRFRQVTPGYGTHGLPSSRPGWGHALAPTPGDVSTSFHDARTRCSRTRGRRDIEARADTPQLYGLRSREVRLGFVGTGEAPGNRNTPHVQTATLRELD